MKQKVYRIGMLLCAILIVMMFTVVCSAAEVVSSGQCGDNITWTLTDDRVLRIEGIGEIWDCHDNAHGCLYCYDYFEKIGVWPDDCPAPYVFWSADYDLVYISEGVTKMGYNCFGCNGRYGAIVYPASITNLAQPHNGITEEVYYYGTPEQWEALEPDPGEWQYMYSDATIHYMVMQYDYLEDGTHAKTGVCSDCGSSIDEGTEPCVDENEDGLCDLCKQVPSCDHDGYAKLTYAPNGDGKTHKVTIDCVTCGEILYTPQTEQECIDEDGFCGICGQKLFCRHGQTQAHTSYSPTASEGTHEVYVVTTCDLCGEEVSVQKNVEACVDTQPDLQCDYCGQALACRHLETTAEKSYCDNGDRTHKIIADMICNLCGETVSQQTVSEAAACTDKNNDDVCDLCQADVSCDHNGNSKLIYISNKDSTHTVTLNCAICMDVLYDVMAAENCSFADGVCTKCGDGQIERFTMAGSNMDLGNELGVNFLFKKTDLKGTGYTAIVTQYLADGTTRVTEVAQADWSTMGSTYHKVPVRIAAKEMADQLSIEIIGEDGYVVNMPYSTSVQYYVGRALAASLTEHVRIMMIDMLNYGAAAQQHFGYNTANLANSILTKADQADATAKIECVNNQVKGTNLYGANLRLEDSIELNVYFQGLKGKDLGSMYAIISFTDYVGVFREIRVEGSEFKKGIADDIYGVVVDDIVLADAKQLVTVTVYNADGTVFGSGSDSVESYVARAEANNADTYGLYANIMKFATSAYNYLVNR